MDSPEPIEFDELLHSLTQARLKRQMFDPPAGERVSVAGRPVLRIPDSEEKFPDFMTWWREVGRLRPDEPQGWSTLSGPWVMRNRSPLIPANEWEALPDDERALLQRWTLTFPIGMFYD